MERIIIIACVTGHITALVPYQQPILILNPLPQGSDFSYSVRLSELHNYIINDFL